jgi:hypothetical protein
MKMKTIDEINPLKKQFLNEYKDAFKLVGNNLGAGIGKNEKTGELVIRALLTNDKLKHTLPEEYHGVKIEVEIIGVIRAL